MSKTVKIAMIGTGDISGIYLKNITETFHEIELAGVCDLVREKAEAAARIWYSSSTIPAAMLVPPRSMPQ